MTLDISGWTIVWVFLLLLGLILIVTTWVFSRLVKPTSSALDGNQNKDNEGESQDEKCPSRDLATKKDIKSIVSKLEKLLKKETGEDINILEVKIDELVRQTEIRISQLSSGGSQLDELIGILGDKDEILKTMRSHFNFHGFKPCNYCGYAQMPNDIDAVYCPKCGENQNKNVSS